MRATAFAILRAARRQEFPEGLTFWWDDNGRLVGYFYPCHAVVYDDEAGLDDGREHSLHFDGSTALEMLQCGRRDRGEQRRAA